MFFLLKTFLSIRVFIGQNFYNIWRRRGTNKRVDRKTFLNASKYEKIYHCLFVLSINGIVLTVCTLGFGKYIFKVTIFTILCSNYSDFFKRHLYLRNRLLDQGYKTIRLIWSLKKFIFRYQDLVEIYSVSAETMMNDGFSQMKMYKDKDLVYVV